MISWRIYAIIILMTLSVLDLALTYYYIHSYRNWQSEKPFSLMEKNPLLVFLWNNFGLHLGMLIGSVIILSLIYLVAKTAHPLIVLLLGGFLVFALFNHYTNINLLTKLIEKYPNGKLPEEIFGKVVGNNK